MPNKIEIQIWRLHFSEERQQTPLIDKPQHSASWTSGSEVIEFGANSMNGLCVQTALDSTAIARKSKRHHCKSHSQLIPKCLSLFRVGLRGSGQILWASLVSCPRAAFFCLIKMRIVFKPVVLSRSCRRGVRYSLWKWGFTNVYVCHDFISPFQNDCWL